MLNYFEMFIRQGNVGALLTDYLEDNGITKKECCTRAGVSRPTLDKVLAGTVTSISNYAKHLEKIVSALNIPDEYLNGGKRAYRNRIRELGAMLSISPKVISDETGIPEERVREIEKGSSAEKEELWKIALFMETSTAALLGENIFHGQCGMMPDYLSPATKELSGFCGHIGILPKNAKKYRWYPITRAEWEHFEENREDQLLVVPCMDNKVLLLNMDNINDVLLLDDACGVPEDCDWDESVSEGEVPLVVYEMIDERMVDTISEDFEAIVQKTMKEYEWSEEMLEDLVDNTRISYIDGFEKQVAIAYNESYEFCRGIEELYLYGDEGDMGKRVCLVDYDLVEIYVNLDNVSVMEMPLLQVEAGVRSIGAEIE